MEHVKKSGVSIIVLNQNNANRLNQLLITFMENNTYYPLEFIIADLASQDNSDEVVNKWSKQLSIQYIIQDKSYSFSASNNYAAKRAQYPYLLFMSNKILFSADVLPLALAQLQNENIGVVGIRLDDDPESLPPGEDPSVQHVGVKLAWDKINQLYYPYQPRLQSIADAEKIPSGLYPAVTGDFLLCRKADFDELGGFCEEYEYGLEDIDYCLNLKKKKNKLSLCINDISLNIMPEKSFKLASKASENDISLFNRKYTVDFLEWFLRNERRSHYNYSKDSVQNFNVHQAKKADIAQKEENLLRVQKWQLLVKDYGQHIFNPPDLCDLPPIGWVHPHLKTCGGIRRAIEMSNRLSDWGADFYLITPKGIKTDWLPIRANVISFEEALHKEFAVLLVSDPSAIDMFNSLIKEAGLFYHLHAYMLYRKKNDALNLYYSLCKKYPNVSNSQWTADKIKENFGISSLDILPGGIYKSQFKPYIVDKIVDTCFFGAKNRKFKATKELNEALEGLSKLPLAAHNLRQDMLAPAISFCRVFVSGSYYEGFNFCPLEAMACGVPVVMTDCGGSREYAVNEENALVVPNGDYNMLREQVDRLLCDSELRLRLIENGMETVWKFDWDNITARLANILATLANKNMTNNNVPKGSNNPQAGIRTIGHNLQKLKSRLKREIIELRISGKKGRTDQRSKGKNEIKHLRTKLLEFGFTERAYSELYQFAIDRSNPSLQKRAAWELALWHADKYSKEDAHKCFHYLSLATSGEMDQKTVSKAAILEAECHDQLGDRERGKKVIQIALNSAPNPDLYLAAANLELNAPEKHYYINQALELTNTSKITFDSSVQGQFLDNINPKSEANTTAHPMLVSPKVTVIIPAYNAEKTIHTALDSILAQTWSNMEILVVDDYSSDSTAEVAREYEKKDSRVRLIEAEKNRGPYVTRNIALKVATGEFVTCKDADDWSHPQKIETQVRHLLEKPDIVANASRWARATNGLKFYRRGNPGFYIQLNISSLMFRRQLIMDKLGFWDSVLFGADTELYNRIKRVFGNEAVQEISDKILSFARCSENSLTENKVFGYPGYIMGARKEYRDSYLYYYSLDRTIKYQFPQIVRPFPVPEIMCADRDSLLNTIRQFDVVLVSDFRLSDNVEFAIKEIGLRKKTGACIGLVQMARYDLNSDGKIDGKLRKEIDGKSLQMLVYGEQVSCEKLIIYDPAVLQEKQLYIPDIKANRISVIIDQLPKERNGSDGLNYVFRCCAEHLREYFSGDAIWYPLNTAVRARLEKNDQVYLKAIELAKENWSDILTQEQKYLSHVYYPDHSAYKYSLSNHLFSKSVMASNYGEAEEDESIIIIDANNIGRLSYCDPEGVAVVMPSSDIMKSLGAARMLVKKIKKKKRDNRAGMITTVIVVNDTMGHGFVRTLNETVAQMKVKYITYLTEEAFPGLDWLKIAYDTLEVTGKSLLAYNCGKWNGRVAAYGLVRTAWVCELYGGPIFYPGYRTIQAVLELTVIARLMDAYVYAPDSTLVNIDFEKVHNTEDNYASKLGSKDLATFRNRIKDCFNARFNWPEVKPYREEYLKLAEEGVAEKELAFFDEEEAIQLLDIKNIAEFSYADPAGTAVIMPCIDKEKGIKTAKLLLKRSGIRVRIFIVEDTLRQGFIKTVNSTASQINVKYCVYLAEDAFPGINWLRNAYNCLEESNKGLLAFNCGKWRGRVAAFGMVRMEWVKKLYGGPIFYRSYQAHKADNEITVIARVTEQLAYEPNATLVEYDPHKVLTDKIKEDRLLFDDRFRNGFEGLAPVEKLQLLAAEYFVELPDKEKNDQFIFYRIVGNDLYPRHKLGQSFENLQFILKHEPELANCKKKFIVNRIIDPDQEERIIALIESHGYDYIRIPFKMDEYKKIGFDMDITPQPGFLSSKEYESLKEVNRCRVITALYRLKNNYVMNNNGARNVALWDGRDRARWILPWDGNCFLTEEAWEQICRDIAKTNQNKYFTVPMVRMLSNDALINNGEIPEAVEEPQIIFRNDARENFNEQFCYGRRPKVELLWRLGVNGNWDNYRDDPWDLKRPPLSPEADKVDTAGWVARLYSGMSKLEEYSDKGLIQRGVARMEGIISTLRYLDARSMEVTSDTPVVIRLKTIAAEVEQQAGQDLNKVVAVLLDKADKALTRMPGSVLDKTILPPSGNKQDYWHPAPYWWPNPETPDGLPYIRRDGERVPGTRMYEPESKKYDRTRLQHVFDDSFVLSLAWKFTGQERYAEHGAKILERFFVDPDSQMTPHLKYGQVRMGHNDNMGASTGIIEMKDMYFYLDAVRLLESSGAVSKTILDKFRKWLATYLEWLITSPQGKGELKAVNNHGTCYDLQVASIASFIGDRDIVYETLVRSMSRISQQFTSEGCQSDEMKRKTTAHYCCFNLQSWINLAEVASRWGVELWDYVAPGGAGLKKGVKWLLVHMGKPWPYEQIDEFDSTRFYPIWFAARERIDDLPNPDGLPDTPYHVKPVFFPHDGIRPFWNLGSYGKK